MPGKALGWVLCMIAFTAQTEKSEVLLFSPGPPPAAQVDVVALRKAGSAMRLAVATLQGQVNRESGRLYVLLSEPDEFWLEQLQAKGYVANTRALDADALFAHYRAAYETVFVHDPAVPASINVATMLASLERGIVAAPNNLEMLAKDKRVTDLRGRWSSNAEAYAWAFEELYPRMNPGILASYHPTGSHHGLRDYLVQRKVFHFWVTAEGQPGHKEEMDLLKRILKNTPVNIPVLGFWYSGADKGIEEYTGVGLAGEHGKITVVADHSTNLSFLSGVHVKLEKAVQDYRARVEAHPDPAFSPEKTYLCIDIVESGDAPVYVQHVQHLRWREKARGDMPVNWSQGPGILELAPSIAEYFYEQASPNDYLYAALSGVGYTHPYRNLFAKTPHPEAAWKTYLEKTRAAMQRMGCNELSLYTDSWKDFDRGKNDSVSRRFIDAIPELNLLILGMGRDEGRTAENGVYTLGDRETVVAHILTRWPTDYASRSQEENNAWLAEVIRKQTPKNKPAFLHVMALSWAYGPDAVAAVLKDLGDNYVPLTLPQFLRLRETGTVERSSR
jgi:hypothetical protein